MRPIALLVALACAATALLAPPASACCHLYGDEGDVGPCHYLWTGDLVFTSEQRLDQAHVSCAAGPFTQELHYVPCDGRLPEGAACLLP